MASPQIRHNYNSLGIVALGGLPARETVLHSHSWDHPCCSADMAAYLDMNRGHISDIERGKREAGIITFQIIATGLG